MKNNLSKNIHLKNKNMKKQFQTIAAVAAVALAVVFTTSCDMINKATEIDIAVGDFSFNIETATAAESPTRAGGGTHFAGSQTITRAQLLEGVAEFDYGLVRSVALEEVSIEIEQALGEVGIENLKLACEGTTTVEITDAPLSSIAATQQEALKTFASAVITKIIVQGEATVSLDATFDGTVSEETVGYLIALSKITLIAGLNL